MREPGVDQVGQDPLRRADGDADRVGDVPQAHVGEEAQAHAVVRELVGVDGVALEPGGGAWEVTVGDGTGDRLVVAVLDAVRRALTGQPNASALVLLDGREYQLQGE